MEDAGANEVIEAPSASEGFRLYRERKPDVIVVDLAMQAGALNGLSFVRRLRRIDQRTPVLVLTMHRDPTIVGKALELGVTGYVLKDSPLEEIRLAFEVVRGCKPFMSEELSASMVLKRPKKEDDRLGSLSPRELQVLTLVSQGRSYKEISSELGVSYSTVAKVCTRLKKKLGVRTRPELIRIAIERFPTSGIFAPT